MRKRNNEVDGFKFSFKDQQQCQTLTPKFQSIEIQPHKFRNAFSQQKQEKQPNKRHIAYSRFQHSANQNANTLCSDIGYQTYQQFKTDYNQKFKHQQLKNSKSQIKRVIHSVDKANRNYWFNKSFESDNKINNRLDQFKQYIAKKISNKNAKINRPMKYFNNQVFNDDKMNAFKQKSQRSKSLVQNSNQNKSISIQKSKNSKNFKRVHTIQTKYITKQQEQQFIHKVLPQTMKHIKKQHQALLRSVKTPKQTNYERLKMLNRKILLNNTKALFTSQKRMSNLKLNNVQLINDKINKKQKQQ